MIEKLKQRIVERFDFAIEYEELEIIYETLSKSIISMYMEDLLESDELDALWKFIQAEYQSRV